MWRSQIRELRAAAGCAHWPRALAARTSRPRQPDVVRPDAPLLSATERLGADPDVSRLFTPPFAVCGLGFARGTHEARGTRVPHALVAHHSHSQEAFPARQRAKAVREESSF